ncbi:MAG: cytochrome c biogenesis protein ResB [Thermoguttaceae bacterium]
MLIYRFAGSLVLAVILMTLLAVILGITTFIESDFGTNVVKFFVYDSWWFTALLFLICVNVLCSMLLRVFPVKAVTTSAKNADKTASNNKVTSESDESNERIGNNSGITTNIFNKAGKNLYRKLPFFTVHTGIIVLMLGCLITAKYGQEARVSIFEGKSARFAVADGYHFSINPVDFNEEPLGNGMSPHFQPTDSKKIDELLQKNRESETTIPFRGGPFNWRLYDKTNWFSDANTAASKSWLRTPLWYVMGLVGKQDGVILNTEKIGKNKTVGAKLDSQLKIEVLDYYSNAEKMPADPLEMNLLWKIDPTSETPPSELRETEKCRLTIAPVTGSVNNQPRDLGLGAAFRTKTGELVTFRVAESEAEATAFRDSNPSVVESGLGSVVLHVRGRKFTVSLDEMLKKMFAARPELDKLNDQLALLIQQKNRQLLTDQAGETASELKPLTPDQQKPEGASDPEPDSEVKAPPISIKKIDDAIAKLYKQILDVQRSSFIPLGDTKFYVGAALFNPEGPDINEYTTGPDGKMITKRIPTGPRIGLVIMSEGDRSEQMLLYSDRPDLNINAKEFGVFGTYCFNYPQAVGKVTGLIPQPVLDAAKSPRLDIMQTPSGRLVYRYWHEKEFTSAGEIKNGEPFAISGAGKDSVVLSDIKFKPHDFPGYYVAPIQFAKGLKYVPDQWVKVRVVVDGNTETFWIRSRYLQQNPFLDVPEEERVKLLYGNGNTLRFTFDSNEIDLGFSIFLRKFTQRMEPGTKMSAHFSSLVDVRLPEATADRIDLTIPGKNSSGEEKNEEDTGAILEEVLIKMNQPGLFKDQYTGRKYRVYQESFDGPFGPTGMQSMPFHYFYDKRILPGDTRPREAIYKSVLSVNFDPGRGIKYLGCAMLVFGTAWMLIGRKKKPSNV